MLAWVGTTKHENYSKDSSPAFGGIEPYVRFKRQVPVFLKITGTLFYFKVIIMEVAGFPPPFFA
jgi:hypothetical protein